MNISKTIKIYVLNEILKHSVSQITDKNKDFKNQKVNKKQTEGAGMEKYQRPQNLYSRTKISWNVLNMEKLLPQKIQSS